MRRIVNFALSGSFVLFCYAVDSYTDYPVGALLLATTIVHFISNEK